MKKPSNGNGRKFWTWVEQSENEPRTLYLYGSVAEESWWEDDVTPQMFRDELFADEGDIVLWINSPGGDCVAASQIYTMLMEYKGNVTVKIDGIAASAASVIAIQGDTRKITKISRHFVHFGGVWSLTERHSEIEKIYEQTKDYAERIDNLYLQACPGLSPEKLRSLQLDERGYLNAEQCVEYGLCDSIVEDDLADMNNIHNQAESFEELFEDYSKHDYKSVIKKLEKMDKTEHPLTSNKRNKKK